MEHAQRDYHITSIHGVLQSLNPYFNGTCSKRYKMALHKGIIGVLILILMEHAQRGEPVLPLQVSEVRLNPYFNGTCSKSTKI